MKEKHAPERVQAHEHAHKDRPEDKPEEVAQMLEQAPASEHRRDPSQELAPGDPPGHDRPRPGEHGVPSACEASSG